MKIGIAQINTIVGDFEGNLLKMKDFLSKADGLDLVVFPECAICGYPQQDLLDYPSFAAKAEEYSNRLIAETPGKSFIFGSIERNEGKGKPCQNIALFASEGKVLAKYRKRLLPTYDVFDEDRFFEPGREPCVIEFAGEKISLTICEDIWNNETQTTLHNRYDQNPLEESKDAKIHINLSSSPFEYEKTVAKREMLRGLAKRYSSVLVYANSVGANDGIIFDGRSYVWSAEGECLAEGKRFEEDFVVVDTSNATPISISNLSSIEDIYDALVFGIKEYCAKQKFLDVVLGLSGGLDSSLVACLAIDALGVDNVIGVLMPSRYTSQESNEDAIGLAKLTQIPIHLLPIEMIFGAALRTLDKTFEGLPRNITEENLQSRARGMILMAISNKFGPLVLSTGNKSELAVGYSTLYGDLCGGLTPISDVYKTQAYELAREANRRKERIPERVFTKAPTAELRPNQKDQDHLPPYERLDKILKALIEDFRSPEEILTNGDFEKEEVMAVAALVRASEYKRFQMPLGLKVSKKAFGIGRRMPIVQRFT